ncbi:hypothetical protein GOBAR_AA24893 [Gossypium barbadense]|uniref:Uncharacterized protein n=1 Tax=Gossypium barbadense TaxID=3634 RepID=A0A2P5WXH1_GOSBA|nr:hypothetical protein GOBAR_AA24893 [Gossypium barbadense]
MGRDLMVKGRDSVEKKGKPSDPQTFMLAVLTSQMHLESAGSNPARDKTKLPYSNKEHNKCLTSVVRLYH